MSQESKKQTAVEWLEERYNHLALMRSREEISAALAVEWLENFLEQAKEMEKEQKEFCWDIAYLSGGFVGQGLPNHEFPTFEQYYTETYGKQQNA